MPEPTVAMTAGAPDDGPTADDVRAELGRILSSPALQASARRRAFLRFVVEETLAGRAGRLKGFTVAVAVFDRDETFDPQSDPVVRIEARRLRRDLDCYYVDAGRRNPVRISIPKGSYVPSFEWREPLPSTEPQTSGAEALAEDAPPGRARPAADTKGGRRIPPRRMALAAMAIAFLAAALSFAMHYGEGERATPASAGEPELVVLPFDSLSHSAEDHAIAEGIGQELVRNIMQFPGFRLFVVPPGSSAADASDPLDRGRLLGVAYVVTGSVRTDEGRVGVAAQVLDAASGRVLWTGSYDRKLSPGSLMRVPAEIAAEIATAIGQPYGVVNTDLAVRTAGADAASIESYVCVLRAYAFRRSFALAELAPVQQCLAEAVRRDPAYVDAWAMLGWVHLDEGRINYRGDGDGVPAYEKALEATTHAVALDPENTRALKALAAVNHYLGRYAESERLARRALELNPNDPETMAQLGWRLAVRGNFDEGVKILKQAIERTLNPPSWYFHLVAIDLYLRGDFGEMRRIAERSALNDRGVGQALVAIACGELGDAACARRALDDMAQDRPFARDPEAFLRRHGAINEIVDALLAGLDKARRVAS